MTPRTKPFLLLLFAVGIVMPVSAQWWPQDSTVQLSRAHNREINAVVAHPSLPLFFTAGADGRLSVWDQSQQSLVLSIQINARPITHLAHHPSRNEVAVYVRNGVGSGIIQVVNWEDGSTRFATDVSMSPDGLEYSPAGSHLIYTTPTYQSLHFLSADTGRSLDILSAGFGAVGFLQMSGSERNVVTYLPGAGSFVYWQVASGRELQRIRTLSGLNHMTVIDLQSRRYLAAASDDQLVIVDNLTGDTAASYPLSPVYGITYDPPTNTMLVLTEQLGRKTTLAFTYRNGELRRAFYRPQNLPGDTTQIIALTSGTGYASASESGEVSFYAPATGRRTVFGPVIGVPIEGVAAGDGALYLLSDNRIVQIESDLFAGETTERSGFSTSTIQIDEVTLSGIIGDDDGVLVWGETEDSGSFVWRLAPGQGTPSPLYAATEMAPVLTVEPTLDSLWIVHRDGSIVQVSRDGTIEFTSRTVGAQDLSYIPSDGIMIGKTKTSDFDSSLVIINPDTGETLPVETDGFLTTDTVYDSRSASLYAVTLSGTQASPELQLTRHTGNGFSRTEVLGIGTLEPGSTDLHRDGSTGRIIANLSDGGLMGYSGRRAIQFDPTAHVPVDITSASGLVYAVNKDGTASIWRSSDGSHLVDLYLFADNQWIALAQNGMFVSSSLSTEGSLSFVAAERSRLEREDFRLTPPFSLNE